MARAGRFTNVLFAMTVMLLFCKFKVVRFGRFTNALLLAMMVMALLFKYKVLRAGRFANALQAMMVIALFCKFLRMKAD